MYDTDFSFIPFGVSRIKIRVGEGLIGYADYRIFGLRIVRIQETRPYQ